MKNKFTVICMDPPYMFNDTLTQSDTKRGADANYDLLTNEDIKNLKISELADPEGAILALWVPSSLLEFGMELMKHYGFQQKQTYIWHKTKLKPLKDLKKTIIKSLTSALNSNILTKDLIKDSVNNCCDEFENNFSDNINSFYMGRLFRQTHEICLIGINNNNIYKKLNNKSQRSVSSMPNLKHSQKPDNLQKSLEVMFPNNNYLEIFARRQLDGWVCLGNESPSTYGEDIRDSLENLINS